MREHWSGHDSMVVWATDHGCHVDEVIGHGNHGTEEERDMNIMHYFGVYPRK